MPMYCRGPRWNVKAAEEHDLALDAVPRVVKWLYGFPDSGFNCYLTYIYHHLVRLGMERSQVDPCVLFKPKGRKLFGEIVP